MKKINVGIVGYGNLGKGVEKAIQQNPDFDLKAIFTRRSIVDIKPISNTKVVNIKDVLYWKEKLDVLILCGGSATDLPVQGPELLHHFNTVDSYDTHANIPKYYKAMEQAGIKGNNLGLISIGWDPGLFSMMRFFFKTLLPNSHTESFWGPGVSQGHSDAIRRIPGVSGAIQYTIPKEDAVIAAEEGKTNLTTRDKHLRECYVAVDEGANKEEIELAIKTMPNYFADYDTVVHFISLEELKEKHSKLLHGGQVLTHGTTGDNSKQLMKFLVDLESNPEFTSSVLVAYARAVVRMAKEGMIGAVTIYDVPLSYLSVDNNKTIIEKFL